MPDDIGWWIFDAETQTLINRWSAQRVRCEGAVDGTGQVRLRFSYQETAIPHLRRSDGNAVMLPCGIEGALDKEGWYYARAFFFYADEDVLLRLEGRSQAPAWKGGPGTWRFELDELLDLGVRDPDAGELLDGLVCSRAVYDWRGPCLQPLPRLAHRLTAALIDG